MKVNIVAPRDNWILKKVCKELCRRLDYSVLTKVSKNKNINEFDINYYINYSLFSQKSKNIDIGLFTHVDHRLEYHYERFFNIARNVDFCICMSKKYEDILKENGIKNVTTINLGIDINFFKPKLILGFAGKLKSSGRKGNKLLRAVSKIDFVDLRITNGILPEEEIPNFYRQLDYVLIASKIEGGPMCLVEGLACGIPIIAPKDVGQVSDFNYGIHHYENSNYKSLKNVLNKLYEKKLRLRNEVKHLSWDNCAEKHDDLFKKLLK
jgi:glycosyltransferase involved in cell wall biosynthesis